MRGALVDTGPLVALLDRRDAHHAWARKLLDTVQAPMRTCEAVVSEACFLLRRVDGGAQKLLDLVERNIVLVTFRLQGEVVLVRKLVARYANVPMAFADACLVRMTELDAAATVVTLDKGFRVYRKHGRQAVPVILPE